MPMLMHMDAYGPYGYAWTLTYEQIIQVKFSKLGGAFRPPRETSDNHYKGFDLNLNDFLSLFLMHEAKASLKT